MAVVQKTYAELGTLWGVSKEAARKKVEGLHLPRRPGNDGRVRVNIDLAEVTHTPRPVRLETAGRPTGDRSPSDRGDREETGRKSPSEVAGLLAQIADLQARVAEFSATLDRERGERERERGELVADRDRERDERLAERDRADKITVELAELAKRFAGIADDARRREQALEDKLDAIRAEMAALRARPWWRRMMK